MKSLDTNILLYAADEDCREHDAAIRLVNEALRSPADWMLARIAASCVGTGPGLPRPVPRAASIDRGRSGLPRRGRWPIPHRLARHFRDSGEPSTTG